LTDAGLGETVTVATGAGRIVKLATPDFPSLLAETVTAPTATAVTNPDALTLALVVSLDTQAIARPVSGLPLPSSAAAVSCCVLPTAMLADAGVTVTDATGGGSTVTSAEALLEPTVAVTCACPGATAVTTPALETDTIPLFEELHATTPMPIDVPNWSRPITLALAVWPTTMLLLDSERASVVNTLEGVVGVLSTLPPHPAITAARTHRERRQHTRARRRSWASAFIGFIK
jgi:hypothetical protein